MYSKEWCPYCAKAKALLRSKGLTYTDVVGEQITAIELVKQV